MAGSWTACDSSSLSFLNPLKKSKSFIKFGKSKRKVEFLNKFTWSDEDRSTYEDEVQLLNDLFSPMHYVAAVGSVKTYNKLWSCNVVGHLRPDVKTRTATQLTALHFAAVFDNADLIEKLVYKGADINAKDTRYGYTPLHFATYMQHLRSVKVLIGFRAELHIKDKNNREPLQLAQNPGAVRAMIEDRLSQCESYAAIRTLSQRQHTSDERATRMESRQDSQEAEIQSLKSDVAALRKLGLQNL